MNAAATSVLTSRTRSTSLALASMVVWLAAAASTGAFGIWRTIGGAAVALGVAVLLFDRPASTALLQPSPRLILLGATSGALMVVATYLLYPALARVVPRIATDTARLYAAFRAPSLVVASVAIVPVIVGEELVWRGAVQASLVERLGAWRGVALAAVVYALVHAPLGSPVLVVVAFFCGLAWGALRAKTASLVPTLVAHLVWDVLVLLWLPLDSGCGIPGPRTMGVRGADLPVAREHCADRLDVGRLGEMRVESCLAGALPILGLHVTAEGHQARPAERLVLPQRTRDLERGREAGASSACCRGARETPARGRRARAIVARAREEARGRVWRPKAGPP